MSPRRPWKEVLRQDRCVNDRVIEEKIMRGRDRVRAGRSVAETVVSHEAVAKNIIEGRVRAWRGTVVVNIDIPAVVIADVSQGEIVGSALLEKDTVTYEVVEVIEFRNTPAGGGIAIHAVLVHGRDLIIGHHALDAAQLQPDATRGA